MEKENLRSLELEARHTELGAKMVPFAGFNMPIQYTSVVQEHLAVRNDVGIFDVSHMGEFWVTGPKALDLIQKISSNDATKLSNGQAQYSCMPNHDGGIVDDLIIYKIDDKEYMLVVNGANIDKDWEWINSANEFGAQLENKSDDICLFAVQGPASLEVVSKLTDVDLQSIKYYSFEQGTVAGIDDVIISATGYTGESGLELYVPKPKAIKLWDTILEAGKDQNILPIGLGARDTLRLEMGYCLYGNDINNETSPLEAGLGWITKFTKDFINSGALRQQKEAGVQKKLVGFEMIDKGIPRKDYLIFDGENEIGIVTSGCHSPLLEKGIGMGYVTIDQSTIGSEIEIQVRKKKLKAQVVKAPFIKKK